MKSNDLDRSTLFPWELGVFDAHCHPTDTMPAVENISSMKTKTLAIMATRGQDQQLVAEVATRFNSSLVSKPGSGAEEEQSDRKIVPCFGWHPWFSHQIYDDIGEKRPTKIDKSAHYKAVLVPPIDDERLLNELPDPIPLSVLLAETKQRLLAFPYAGVGEIGLDRSFRIPNAWFPHEVDKRDTSLTPGSREGRTFSPYRVQLTHQKVILKAQLRLAGELQRFASIHSVQAHGAVLEIFDDLFKGHEKKVLSKRQIKRRGSVENAHCGDSEDESEISRDEAPQTSLPFPRRVCMHSYSGPVEPLKLFFRPSNPADFYFSFSSIINFPNGSISKALEVVKEIPEDRILVESDLHRAGHEMDERMEAVVRKTCQVREWGLEEGVKRLGDNWIRFLQG